MEEACAKIVLQLLQLRLMQVVIPIMPFPQANQLSVTLGCAPQWLREGVLFRAPLIRMTCSSNYGGLIGVGCCCLRCT